MNLQKAQWYGQASVFLVIAYTNLISEDSYFLIFSLVTLLSCAYLKLSNEQTKALCSTVITTGYMTRYFPFHFLGMLHLICSWAIASLTALIAPTVLAHSKTAIASLTSFWTSANAIAVTKSNNPSEFSEERANYSPKLD